MRSVFFLLLAAAAASGCRPGQEGALAADDPSPPRISDIAKDFKHLRPMTADRVFVDPELAMLCRGASRREVEEARKKNGPHAHTSILVSMNDLAAEAFRRSSTPYPIGSIIVKEKTGQSYDSGGRDRVMKSTHDGVGGMVKRPPGFDAAHGDWEYFYFEDPSRIESGAIRSCVGCHSGASGRDHVFGGWADGAHRAPPRPRPAPSVLGRSGLPVGGPAR